MTSDIKSFAAALSTDAPKLDLHGRDPHEIQNQIDQFLYAHFLKKDSYVEIIYGIGKGVLGKITLEFLATHPLVEKVIDKGASCIVLLSGQN